MKFVVALLLVSLALGSARVAIRQADVCSSGKAQSPIDVVFDKTTCVRSGEVLALPYKINRHYKVAANVTVQKVDNTITAKGDFGFVTVGGCNPCDGQGYNIVQVALKAPAEHTFDGKRYAGELQITHQKQGSTGSNDLLVSSVFFYQQADGGFTNSFLDSIDVAHASATAATMTGLVDLEKLKESFRGEFFTYKGSLVNQGCPETVQWVLYRRPLGVTADQLKAVQTAVGNTTPRAAQAVNDRQVMWYRKRV